MNANWQRLNARPSPLATRHSPLATGRGGFLGAFRLADEPATRLGDWLSDHGARSVSADPACRLWQIGMPFGGLSPLTDASGALAGWWLGDLQAPADADPGTLIADPWQRAGHQAAFALAGQFALILMDRAAQTLGLFRDGSAAQALYYAGQPDGALLFSDRLDLLANCPLITPAIDPAALHEYLRLLDISSPRTPYVGIASVAPDQLLVAGPAGLHRMSKPEPPPRAPAPATLERAADALEEALAAAVAARLQPAGDTVVFLSGGVDSACLCALAAAAAPGRVIAVTVGFAEPDADESAIASAIARHLGVYHELLRFDLDTYRAAFDTLAEQADYPFADPAGAATLLAFQHACGLAATALDGTGADTLLGIMPARHQRLAVAWAALLPAGLRAALARALAPIPRLRDYRPLLDFGDPEEVLMRWRGFPRREIAALVGAPVSLAESRFYQVFRTFPRHAHFERYSALMGHLPDDRLHVAAHLTGLRVRFPFFDPAVVALVRGLPRALRWRAAEPKRVLKAVLARRLPRTLWDVPKHGFDFPFVALLADHDYALVRETLDPARLHAAGLLDPAPVTALVQAFITGERRAAFQVWGLVVLFAWLACHRH